MHIKFSKTGSGKAKGLVRYLLSEKDSKGEVREEIKVLRNDPNETAELAESLKFQNTHKHAIIAFSKSDNPTDEQIHEVLEDFEKVAFAGLEKNQYSWSAVQHIEEDGAKHVHIIVANVELATGKSMNIAPPGWMSWTDPIRDKHNLLNEWESPDIEQYPEQARLIQPDFRAYLKKKTARDDIESYLYQQIQADKVKNRSDVIKVLKDVGFKIPRAGKNYITAHDPDSGIKIRLKGALFNESWRAEQFNIKEHEREGNSIRTTDRGRLEELQRKIIAKIQTRSKFNQEYYRPRDNGNVSGIEKTKPAVKSSEVSMDIANIDHNSTTHDGNELGSNEVQFGTIEPVKTGQSDNRKGKQQNDKENQILEVNRKDEISTRSRPKYSNQEGVRVDERREDLCRANTEIDSFSLPPKNENENELTRRIKEGRKIINDNNELERFKLDINLPQYMAKFGYQLNKLKSSRNSYQLENNGIKLVVMTDTDGHGIYFSRDGSSQGSIIDFHQAETGENLGQTRKALRAELGMTRDIEVKKHKKPSKANLNTTGIIKSLVTMKDGFNDYLVSERHISIATQEDKRFSSVIKTDRRNNAVFPHYDETGITGYELKNEKFTAFSRGGKKSFWRSTNFNNADTVVITESAIDCLSHAQLKNTGQKTAYISAGGSMGEQQKELLLKLLKAKTKVILAFDNDKAGQTMAREWLEELPAFIEIPKGKDWNEDLTEQVERKQTKKRSQDMGMSR